MCNNLHCVFSWNLWTGNTKREASVKGNLPSDVWVAVFVPELVLYAEYTN